MPVSTFCLGSGVSVPSAYSSYSMKTRFQNSRNRSHRVQLGLQSGSPQPCSTPQSQYISVSGPHGPGPPTDQKFSERGRKTMRSTGCPISSHFLYATSSSPSSSSESPANTVTQNRSGSSFMCSKTNSQASSIAPSLKYCPNEKLPSISKNVRCEPSSPTSSMSGVRKHFCTVVRSGAGGCSRPRKKGISGCMPAVVSSVERSSARGTSDAEGRKVCPLDSKKARKPARSSAEVCIRGIVGTVDHLALARAVVSQHPAVTAAKLVGSRARVTQRSSLTGFLDRRPSARSSCTRAAGHEQGAVTPDAYRLAQRRHPHERSQRIPAVGEAADRRIIHGDPAVRVAALDVLEVASQQLLAVVAAERELSQRGLALREIPQLL